MICECGCGATFEPRKKSQRFASEKCRKLAEVRRRNGAPGSERRKVMQEQWRAKKRDIGARKREAEKAPEVALAKADARAALLKPAGKANLCAACSYIVRRGSVHPCCHPGLWSERFAGRPAWEARTQGHCPLQRAA